MEKLEKSRKEQQIYNNEVASFYWVNHLHESQDESIALRIFQKTADFKRYWNLVDKKLDTYCAKYGDIKEEVIKELPTNTRLQRFFAIDATRQKIHQKAQELNIREQLKDIEKEFPKATFSLSENEKENRYIINDNGVIKSKTPKDDSFNNSKMFDYVVNVSYDFKNYKIFLINKYTKENGGSQDNTNREMETTYKYCLENTDDNCVFLFVLDGDFWRDKTKHIVDNDRIYRCENYDFKKTLINILSRLI